MASSTRTQQRGPATRPADRWTDLFLVASAIFAAWGVGLIALTILMLATPGFGYPDEAKAALKAAGATVVGILALAQMYTMEAALGHLPRAGMRIGRLLRTHRRSGRVALVLAIVIAFFCMVDIGAPTSPLRGFIHAVFGSTAFTAIALKLALMRVRPALAYRLAPWLGRYAVIAFVAVWITSAYAFFTGTL